MRKVIAVFILHCVGYLATMRANKADILGEQEEVQFQSLYRQGGQEDDFNRERILDCDSWHGAGGHFPSGRFGVANGYHWHLRCLSLVPGQSANGSRSNSVSQILLIG